MNVPPREQSAPHLWIPVELRDGWYGLPSFRFMGIAALDRIQTPAGLECAHPAMMALAILLSHPTVGTARIESGEMSGLLRSAKDLGRVLALARLEGRDGTELWREPWIRAMRTCFPNTCPALLTGLGSGLEELMGDANALEDARTSTDVGLLNGLQVTAEILEATGRRLMEDVVIPIRREARSGPSP